MSAAAGPPGRLRWPLLAVLLVATMYGGWPARAGHYPIAGAPTAESPIVAALRRATGPVLEPPAVLRPADTFGQAEDMYRSIFHWRPLLNGYSSYWPRGFAERMALAAALPAPEALGRLRRETASKPSRAGQLAAWLDVASRRDRALHLVARDGNDLMFAVREQGSRPGAPASGRSIVPDDQRLAIFRSRTSYSASLTLD